MPNNLPPLPHSHKKMAARSSGVVWASVAGQQQWQCQGIGGGASVDVGGGGSSGGRGGAAALALLGSRWGRAADVSLALRTCGPGCWRTYKKHERKEGAKQECLVGR